MGLTRGSEAAERGPRVPSLPSLKRSQRLAPRPGLLLVRQGLREGSCLQPQHHGRQEGCRTGAGSHPPLLLPTGTPAFPVRSLGLGSDLKVQVSCLHCPQDTPRRPGGSFLLQDPALAQGKCHCVPSVIIRFWEYLIHCEVLCVPVIPAPNTRGLGMSYGILTDKWLDLKCTLGFLDHHPCAAPLR